MRHHILFSSSCKIFKLKIIIIHILIFFSKLNVVDDQNYFNKIESGKFPFMVNKDLSVKIILASFHLKEVSFNCKYPILL